MKSVSSDVSVLSFFDSRDFVGLLLQGRARQVTCKCSFLEIYNETITDLLNPSETHLHIREAAGGTTYVENLSEEEVPSGLL